LRKLALALLLLASCAKSNRGFSDGLDLGDGGGTFNNGNGDGGVTTLAECAESTKDVYVLAADATLYEFHPPTLEFKNRGRVSCPASGATPTSMAVDRSGIAWVRYSDGSIWRVSTVDLGCSGTKYAPPADNSFFQFGMGFSSETKGSVNEALFLSDHAGAGLAKLDTTTLQLRAVGPFTGDLAGKTAELTGTGDGKLYGFFTTVPAQIAEISKGTGDILSTKELTGVSAGSAWAFSFYGGDFYVYTASNGSGGFPQAGAGSDVTRYRPSDGSITVVKQATGFTIVGAGVSTCAPTTMPN
jgi:hypothetical protein